MNDSLDQPVRLSPDQIEMFDDVDTVVDRSVVVGDPLIALEFGKHLIQDMQVKGVLLAKLLYKLYSNWDKFQLAGIEGDIYELAGFHLGRSEQTVKKYINMWESIFENDDISGAVKDRLKSRPVGDLLLLTAVAKEGYDLDQMAGAPDRYTLRKMVREARGEQTSAGSAIFLYIADAGNAKFPPGTLYAIQGGESYSVGRLHVDHASDVVQKAIERIKNSAHIQEK